MKIDLFWLFCLRLNRAILYEKNIVIYPDPNLSAFLWTAVSRFSSHTDVN